MSALPRFRARNHAGQARRLAGGAVLLAVAVLAGGSAGVAVFFGAAAGTSSVPAMSVAALIACLLLSSGIAWPAFRVLAARRYGWAALVTGAATTLTLAVVAALTIFKPLALPQGLPLLPPSAAYWELPTGSRIAYLRVQAVGTAKATPIIRLHGGPGAYAVTNQRGVAFFGQLAQDGYDVYLYDQIGSGLSARLDNPEEYTVTRSVADLEAIRQAIGAEQVILLGESWGATLAANYMAAYPEHVARAIFSSPAPINPAEWQEYQADIRLRLSPERQQDIEGLSNHPRLLALMILSGLNPRAAHQFAPDREMDAWMDAFVTLELPGLVCNPATFSAEAPAHGFGFWAGRMVGREFYEQAGALNPRAGLAANQTPTLILRGECDHITSGVVDQYRATFARSTLRYFQGAGHIIYYDQPDRYLAAVRAFLREQPLSLPIGAASW
jgi:pimeloyl-ACP methyl ester carboxylesterase